MAIRQREKMTPAKLRFGLLMRNRYFFTSFFWSDDLTMREGRPDLPEEWVGKQIISKEQRMMMLDNSQRIVFCTARKIFKTGVIESRFIHEAITQKRHGASLIEGLLFTPREHHMQPLINRLYNRVTLTPLFKLMLDNFNRADRRITFGSFMWYMRIEGTTKTGQNYVGLRSSYSMGDEQAFASEGAWTDLQNTFLPMSPVIYAGVPNGMRATPFWYLTNTRRGARYSIHSYPITANPLYHSNLALSEEAIKHGGVRTQGFITQVLGEWGQEAFQTFPIIPTHSTNFNHRTSTGERLIAMGMRRGFGHTLGVPKEEEFEDYIISADIGLTAAPTIVGIWGYKQGTWWLRIKLTLMTTDTHQAAKLIDFCNMHLIPKRAKFIALDAWGMGSGVLDQLHSNRAFLDNDDYARKAYDVGFGNSIVDDSIPIHRTCKSRLRIIEEDAAWACDMCREVITDRTEVRYQGVQAKQYYTERLKDLFTHGQRWIDAGMPDTKPIGMYPRIVLPTRDDEIAKELGGMTEVKSPAGNIRYVPLEDGQDHNTDMIRCACSAIMSFDTVEEVEDQESSFEEYGWIGEPALAGDYRAPWDAW